MKRERSLEIERDSNVTSGSFSTVERKGIVTHFKIYPQKKKSFPNEWFIVLTLFTSDAQVGTSLMFPTFHYSLQRVLSFIWFMRSNLVPGWALFGLQQTLGPFFTLKAQQTQTSTDIRVCVRVYIYIEMKISKKETEIKNHTSALFYTFTLTQHQATGLKHSPLLRYK